jgi:hypothetical protein
MLPAANGDRSARKGAQSETAVTKSFLTALDEHAAQKNNQVSNPKPVNL